MKWLVAIAFIVAFMYTLGCGPNEKTAGDDCRSLAHLMCSGDGDYWGCRSEEGKKCAANILRKQSQDH